VTKYQNHDAEGVTLKEMRTLTEEQVGQKTGKFGCSACSAYIIANSPFIWA